MQIKNALALGILMAFGVSGAALANEEMYENDNNQQVSESSYDGNTYTDYDANDDGYVDNDEYGAGFADSGAFDDWDLDNDGLLDDDEFSTTGVDYGFDDDDFDTWDVNDDGFLDEDETSDGLFSEYDYDNDYQLVGNEYDDAGEEGWFDW